MTRDAELDRLKAEQDRTFQRKQDAYQAMQRAWERRSAARDALDRAHSAKQQTWESQNSAWQGLQWTRDRNGPRIDSLNSQQENAFQNMKGAFDRASSAHDARDGASARMYADDGHHYKQEAQDAVAERRRLVQEIRDARDRHNATKPAFQYAKSQFDDAKRAHDTAKAEHERKQEAFRQARRTSTTPFRRSRSDEKQSMPRQGRLRLRVTKIPGRVSTVPVTERSTSSSIEMAIRHRSTPTSTSPTTNGRITLP